MLLLLLLTGSERIVFVRRAQQRLTRDKGTICRQCVTHQSGSCHKWHLCGHAAAPASTTENWLFVPQKWCPGPLLLSPRAAAAIFAALPRPSAPNAPLPFQSPHSVPTLYTYIYIPLAALPPAVCHSSALRWRALSSTHAQPWLTRELIAVTAEFRYEDMFNVTGIDERVRHSPSPPKKKTNSCLELVLYLFPRSLEPPPLANSQSHTCMSSGQEV
jgi:hypothetical protein